MFTFPSPINLNRMLAWPDNNHTSAKTTSQAGLHVLFTGGRLVQFEISRKAPQLAIDVNGHLRIHRVDIHDAQPMCRWPIQRIFNGKWVPIGPRNKRVDFPWVKGRHWWGAVDSYYYDVRCLGYRPCFTFGNFEGWEMEGG